MSQRIVRLSPFVEHGLHLIQVHFDVAHRRLNVRVVQQALGDMDVSLGLLHQVTRQRMPEA
ncbi:hypothetical protein P3E16_32195, partial [Pseudomonas aeruginosa]